MAPPMRWPYGTCTDLGGENGLIKLQPFTVEDLCSSLLHPGEPVLLAELSCALLRTLLADSTETIQVPPPVYSEVTQPLLLRLPPTPEIITRTNWPEVIRCVGWILPEMHEEGAVNAALYALQENEYSQLPPNYRLTLLKSMRRVPHHKVKTFLKERAERQEAMGVAARKEQAAANKQLREELAAIVPEEGLDPTATGKVFALVFPAVAAPTTNTSSSAASGGGGGGGGGEAPEGSEEGKEDASERKRRRTEATERLLTAIETRSGLEGAIMYAVSNGHEGELSGELSGRPALWCTAELKAARDLLVKEHLRTKREAYKATKDVTALNTLREHIQQLNNLPVREESLGTETNGRRIW